MLRRHLLAGLAATPLAAPLATPAFAQAAWPARGPIRVVVPFPPGGFSDFVARVLTAPMGAALGQTVVVENRPGAGGTLGADNVAKSAPDGYSFIISHVSPHGTAQGVFPQLPYDPVTDFTHLAMICDTPTAILVRRDSPIRDFAGYLAAARASGGVTVGTSGVGSIGHLQSELLQRQSAGTRIEHVPYRGTAPALQDLLAGTIASVFDPLAGQFTQVTGNGPMRVIAVSAGARVAGIDAPTLDQLGLGTVTATAWMGISGPKNLPAPIASRVTEAVLASLTRPEVRQRFEELTVFAPAQPLTGDAYAAFIRDFSAKWGQVARAANIIAS